MEHVFRARKWTIYHIYPTRSVLRARFLKRVLPQDDGCWLWDGYHGTKSGSGYPIWKMKIKGDRRRLYKSFLVSRVACFIFKDDFDHNLIVTHECNNKKCVNPDHLTMATHKKNMKDVVKSGSQRGERNGNARLSGPDVLEARKMRLAGDTWKKIGDRFGVHLETARKAVNGDTWRRK